MKLALVIPSLGDGGAQRVMSILASAWARRGYDVTLITLKDSKADVYFTDPSVKRIELNLRRDSADIGQALANNWRRVRALRDVIRGLQPNAVISFLTANNLLTLVACLGTRIPVIVSERNSVRDQPPRGIWRVMYRHVYRQAFGLVAQTDDGASELRERVGRPVTVIRNPVITDIPAFDRKSAAGRSNSHGSAQKKIIAMGRLKPQKGFDLLLESFAQVACDRPSWNLEILGEGPDRAALEDDIRDRGLVGRVTLPGYCRTPMSRLHEADIFVLSSRYEGMPNALMEAMSCGLASVSFNCRTGPAELIEHGVNGLLVRREDPGALAATLAVLMDDAALRNRLGQAALTIKHRYSLEAVLSDWKKLLQCLV